MRLDHVSEVDDLIELRHALTADRMTPDRLLNLRVRHAVQFLRTPCAHVGMKKERHRTLDLAVGNRAPCRLSGKIRRPIFACAVMQKPRNTRLFHVHAEAPGEHGGGVRDAEGVLVALLLQPLSEFFFHRLVIHEYRPSL